MKKHMKFGIFQRVLLAMLLVSLVPLAGVWLVSFQTSSSLTNQKVEQQLFAINSSLTTHVNDWVDMNQRMLLQNASLQDIRSMRSEQQNPILETVPNRYDWAYLAFTINPEGMNVGRSDGKKPKFYGERDYFKQVVAGERFGKQILIGKTSGQPALILSTAIHDDVGRLNGVLALAMTLTEISGEIAGSRIGKSGFTFLLDENGEVIAHPSEKFTKSRVDMSNHQALQALKAGKSFSIYNDFDGKKVVSVARTTRQGWTMISQQDYSEAYGLIEQEKNRAIMILAGTLISVFIVALIVSRRMTTPIRELTRVADQYSQGNLQLQIAGLERGDEIGQLAQAVERLGTSIRMAIDRLHKK